MEALKSPAVYVAATIVGLQFISGTIMDLILGGLLVGLIAFKSR